MSSHKDRAIFIEDLEMVITRVMHMADTILLELEWSSNKALKTNFKRLVNNMSFDFKSFMQIVGLFYESEHLSTDNQCNIGSVEKWRSQKGSLEETLDRVLDSEKRSN